MAKTRTFIAVEAVDEVHANAMAAMDRLRGAAENVKWVQPENLHWTLQFLGDLSDQEVADVCLRVTRVANGCESFTLAALGVDAFPSAARPRTVWIGAGQGSAEFCNLQEAVETSLANLGFRGERRQFVPHLTLGRVGRGSHGGPVLAERVERLSDYHGGVMAVEEITVYSSQLERDGPAYVPLARAPLG